MPVLIGTNRDEFTLFVALQYLRLGKATRPRRYPQDCSETRSAPTPLPSASATR